MMFSIAIHYLNGWAMAAADGATKEKAEWPPHPDRIFMAMSAAWFETGEDPEEGKALRWLESLDPPAIVASEASYRTSVTHYVPINDESTPLDKKKKPHPALNSMAIGRNRQPRGFPIAIPENPIVRLVWSKIDPGDNLPSLQKLVQKITYVGHSASLVSAWVEDTECTPTWIPVDGVSHIRLRVPSGGRLDYLKGRYNKVDMIKYYEMKEQLTTLKGKKKKEKEEEIKNAFVKEPISLRPEPGRWQGYSRYTVEQDDETIGTIFDPNMIVLKISGKRLPLQSTIKLTDALKGALMDRCESTPPEWLSGHSEDGKPTTKPHMALIPLPFVGFEYSDGRIMGLAIVLPSGLDPEETAKCLGAFLYEDNTGMPIETKLYDGKWFECVVQLDNQHSSSGSLNPELWTMSSRIWASVTPIVLDRHYDGKDKWIKSAETVKKSCERIGLPTPVEILLNPVSLIEGVPHAREYPYLKRKRDRGNRNHCHAVLIFEEPVRGPIIIGAGRYRGYGLCRPLKGGTNHE